MRLSALTLLPLLTSVSHASHATHAHRGLQSREDIERSINNYAAFNKHAAIAKRANTVSDQDLDACPGYTASNVQTTAYSLSADLKLAGDACNVYGPDLNSLKLTVTYETTSRIHVKIGDAEGNRYEVPEDVFPRPKSNNVNSAKAAIQFKYTKSPFTFSIVRKQSGEVLFSTSKQHPLIFEPQYLRLKTASLPGDANIYGLGEHTETFRLPNKNLTRTLWSRDAYSVPAGTNLYGNHPIYFEHRTDGTHGVFLLNSNGMDIKIKQEEDGHTSLEYDIIGGILDLYFLAGPSPTDVAKQYAQIAGLPAEVPYWSLGFHQCRYGYADYLKVAEVVRNYTLAGIPLETMWTDIDLYYNRLTFTNDPDYFPLDQMRKLIGDLHARNQHYVLMVDPAVGFQPGKNYTAYDEGAELGVFLKNPGNTNYTWFVGVVWPGRVVWPDWFHPNASSYWTNQFLRFFDKNTGLDVDGSWIDMNEPASFCTYPCDDPGAQALAQGLPPNRTTAPPPVNSTFSLTKRVQDESGYDLLDPPYSINVASNGLSDRTAYTNIIHANGLTEYDTHNLYGEMMSTKTREALEARRPGQRTFVITRSTFAGAGHKVGKWLGDNFSDDVHYLNSIAGILGFASIYQVPIVGADVCGFGGVTNEALCARWAMLGAFYPFYRNHNELGKPGQEFYQWPTVAEAAKNAIDIRYRLLDYFYTALHQAHLDGTPALNPLFFKYPWDAKTFAIDSQFFYGDSILVSPVTVSNATDVTIYLPEDQFYDFLTYSPVSGGGKNVHLTNISYTSIPLHIKGGSVIPLRATSANTTTDLRTKDFEIAIAPAGDGTANGQLYIDDGISISQTAPVTFAHFRYQDGTLKATGDFASQNKITLISFLGVYKPPSSVTVNGTPISWKSIAYDKKHSVARARVSIPLTGPFTVSIS